VDHFSFFALDRNGMRMDPRCTFGDQLPSECGRFTSDGISNPKLLNFLLLTQFNSLLEALFEFLGIFLRVKLESYERTSHDFR